MGTINVTFLNGTKTTTNADGDNATWICGCGKKLFSKWFFPFGELGQTVCSGCGKKYKVQCDSNKKVVSVVEE